MTPFSISNSSELSSGVARTTLLNYPDPLLGSNVTVNTQVVLALITTYAGFILKAESVDDSCINSYSSIDKGITSVLTKFNNLEFSYDYSIISY